MPMLKFEIRILSPALGAEINGLDLREDLDIETVEAFHMTGKSHDCGSKLGYLQANVEYGLRHPELGPAFKTYLSSLDDA